MLTLPVAMLFPVLWSAAPSRRIAALVSAGYFLAASRGLPQGVATFFASDLALGLLLWCGAALSFVLVQTVFWTARPKTGKAIRFLIATVLMAVPPFGITGWAQPATAAGVLFPGWGWWGLAVTLASLVMLTTAWWRSMLALLGAAWVWYVVTWVPPAASPGWTGVKFEMGARLGREDSLGQQRELIGEVRRAIKRTKVRIVVLPETAIGIWTPTKEQLWQEELHGTDVTVIAGATALDPGGYDGVMVAISAKGGHVLYRERMPVPVSMWQPWRAFTGEPGGARAHPFANPVAEVAGGRFAPLICYEQLIVWPILHSMLDEPTLIVGISNAWWADGSSIPAIQRASLQAWARLFGLPLVVAVNI